MRHQIKRARQLRRNMTEAERFLWQRIRKKQLQDYRFRRQHPIGPYIVDFVCLEAHLIIELDGGQHQEQTDADQHRDDWLMEQGFRVTRFWNNQVFQDTDAVLDTILVKCSWVSDSAPRRKYSWGITQQIQDEEFVGSMES